MNTSGYDETGTSKMIKYGGELSEITPREEMVKIMECPVCQEIPMPPIHNCGKGHIICYGCRKKLSKCPLCKSPFTESRNFALESIVQTSKFVCDYHENGCNSILSGCNLQKHHEKCEFRPMICHLGRMDGCNDSIIEFSNYFEHLIRKHKTIGAKEDSADTFIIKQTFTESTNPKHNWLCTYKKFDGRVFLTRSFKLGANFYWSLAMIGSDSEARKYAVKFTIDRDEEQVPKFELTIPVISIRKTKQDLLDTSPHAVLPEKVLRFFCTVKSTHNKKQLQWRTQYQIIKRNNTNKENTENKI